MSLGAATTNCGDVRVDVDARFNHGVLILLERALIDFPNVVSIVRPRDLLRERIRIDSEEYLETNAVQLRADGRRGLFGCRCARRATMSRCCATTMASRRRSFRAWREQRSSRRSATSPPIGKVRRCSSTSTAARRRRRRGRCTSSCRRAASSSPSVTPCFPRLPAAASSRAVRGRALGLVLPPLCRRGLHRRFGLTAERRHKRIASWVRPSRQARRLTWLAPTIVC